MLARAADTGHCNQHNAKGSTSLWTGLDAFWLAIGYQSLSDPRKMNVRLPEEQKSNSRGARQIHLISTMIKWIQTSRLSMKNSLSL